MTINREEHAAVNVASPVQISFEYANGAGKVELRKVQAEPGVAKPRKKVSLIWSRSMPSESARRKSTLVSHFAISGSAT